MVFLFDTRLRIIRNACSGVRSMRLELRTVTLKLKYADFRIISRSKTLPLPVSDLETLYQTGIELLRPIDLSPKVRLLGISVKKPEVMEWKGDGVQLEIDFGKEQDN